MMKAAALRTQNRILDQGLEILSVSGLAGVTFGSLADAVGMSKSGLFAHFRSKEDIQLQLVARANALAVTQVVAPAMTEPPGLARLSAMMRNWLGWAQRAGLSGGCPITAALFELDDLDGRVRATVGDAEAQSRAVLAALVGEAVADGTLRPGSDIDQIVWELHGIYLSHHVSSRFVANPLADQRAWSAFEALVDRYRQ